MPCGLAVLRGSVLAFADRGSSGYLSVDAGRRLAGHHGDFREDCQMLGRQPVRQGFCALGRSQRMVGMKGSEKNIAINMDADASVFGSADSARLATCSR